MWLLVVVWFTSTDLPVNSSVFVESDTLYGCEMAGEFASEYILTQQGGDRVVFECVPIEDVPIISE